MNQVNLREILEDTNMMESLIENEELFLKKQAFTLSSKKEDAEDLFQETILKVCEAFDSFRKNTNFRAWTRRIMVNTHINNYVKNRVTRVSVPYITMSGNEIFLTDVLPLPVPAGFENPEELFLHNHIDEDIMHKLNSLPEKYRTVFYMFHFKRYTLHEIASALGVPVGTVKSRLYRAKQLLLERMPGENEAYESKN